MATGPAPKFRYRPELNGLRAIAVTAVVLFHASTPGFVAGYLGVDVFFVLSGFLVTSLLLVERRSNGGSSGTIDILAFYGRRVRRLLPASITVLLCTAVAYRFAVDPLSCSRSKSSFISAVYYVANWSFIALDGDYWAEELLVSPVKHYWSLSVEEEYYFAYPLLFMASMWLYRRSSGPVRRLLPLGVVTVCLLSFSFATWLYYEDEVTASYMNTVARLYQLLGGGLLAQVAPDCVLPPFVATLSMIAMTALLLSSGLLPSLWGGLAAFVTTSSLILGLEGISETAADTSWTKQFLSLRPMTVVGACSYSIYLVHFPIVVIGDAMGVLPSRSQPISRTVLVLSSSLALGWLMRQLVELPCHRIPLNTKLRKYGVVLCIIFVPLLVTAPLLTVLSPTIYHADLIRERHFDDLSEEEDLGGNFEADVGAARMVTLGDSHCLSSRAMMKTFFSEKGIHGRSFCRGAFPVTLHPNFGAADARFRDKLLESLRLEATDYLVVWNVKVQFACLYHGRRCSFDDSMNADVDDVRDRYEPAVLEFFEDILPLVNVAVLFMLPEPVAPIDPNTCLSQNSDPAVCDWDVWHMPGYHEAISAYQAVRNASAAMGGPDVLLFNTDEILCPNKRCHAVDHGIPLFENANHVDSDTWVRLLPQVEQLWQQAGISFPDMKMDSGAQLMDSGAQLSAAEFGEWRAKAASAVLGDAEDGFAAVTSEYFRDLLPYMQRATVPTHDEYVSFASQFKKNRERAATIRPKIPHISAALVAVGDQLAKRKPGYRPDLQESIVIPFEELDTEFSWALEHKFSQPDGPPHWPLLTDVGCKESNLFCLSQAYTSLAVALETDFICLWDSNSGWAADIERSLGYDVLVIVDFSLENINSILATLDELQFEGSVFLMPSDPKVFARKYDLANFVSLGVCPVILDNYWTVKAGPAAHYSFYPLWVSHPLQAFQQLNTRTPVDDDPWGRQAVFVATVTGRPSEKDQYVAERREAALFLSEMGYSVNFESAWLSLADYYAYFGKCKYAFLPMVEGYSTGQTIADALVSSNFTVLPFSYGHKLWMRTLPPFLTIRNLDELREKIESLESNETEYRRILADVQAYAPAFLAQSMGQTAAEIVAAIAIAPRSTYPDERLYDCLRLPSLSVP